MMNKRLVQVFKVLLVFNLSLFFCAYVQILDFETDFLAIRTHENQFLSDLERELAAVSNKSANWTTGSIFDVLFAHKAFLVDVDLLVQLEKFNESMNLNFGIYLKEFFSLVKNLEKNQCKCDVLYVKYENLSIPSAAYGYCYGFVLHVSAFYQRANFFWIPGDGRKIGSKFFNKTRALSRFKIVQRDIQDKKIYVPVDLKLFLNEYKNSEFLECSFTLAKKNFNNLGYVQDEKKSMMFSDKLKYIVQVLESLGVEYWLAGGTLLGWYRDCGFIPHTTDLDIGLLSQQHDSRVRKSFLGNKKAALIVEFGFPNDSYELRLDSDKLQIDLFYFYNLNSTHHWCGYQEKRVKKRRFLTKSNLCSGELLGQKYLVPCKVEKYLNEEYGTNLWKVPKTQDYVWSNLIYWKNWTEDEWENAIKFYHQDGSFLERETLDYIKMNK